MDKVKEIVKPVLPELTYFEEELKALVNSCDNFLKEDLLTFLFGSAKRIRPIFIFLFSKILKIDDKNVFNIALASELIHNASLIHDDILDNEISRRNNKTFFFKYNSKIAVLEGDLLLGLALGVLGKTNLDIVKIYSDKILRTINGEIEQDSIINKIPDEKFYLDKIMNKTSNLFLAGLESLFTLNDAADSIKTSLINFMIDYSRAFQIKNDADNILYKDFSDIKNGNYTLPVIYFCMENFLKSFNQDNINAFVKNKNVYIEKTEEKIKTFKHNALKNLEAIEESNYKEAIIKLCEYTI